MTLSSLCCTNTQLKDLSHHLTVTQRPYLFTEQTPFKEAVKPNAAAG